jgi:hypothetical protein
MRKIVLLAALALAAGAWAQEQKKEEAKPAAEDKPKPAAVAKKASPKRHQDARHCLEKASNTEIIKCAEAYL